MRNIVFLLALLFLGCSHSQAPLTEPQTIPVSTDDTFVEPRFGIAFSHFPSWRRTIGCSESLESCQIYLDPTDARIEPSSSNRAPRRITISWYSTVVPDGEALPCDDTIEGSPLRGSVYDTEERMYGDNGFAGFGDGAQACLCDGRFRSAIITADPPSTSYDAEFLRVVRSFRFVPKRAP